MTGWSWGRHSAECCIGGVGDGLEDEEEEEEEEEV